MSEELNDEILGNLLFVERTPTLEIAKFILNLSSSLDKLNENNRMFAKSYSENYEETLKIIKERDQLKVENERLREALSDLVSEILENEKIFYYYIWWEVVERAQQVLEEEKQ